MSDSPDKKHPWAKFRAKPAAPRLPAPVPAWYQLPKAPAPSALAANPPPRPPVPPSPVAKAATSPAVKPASRPPVAQAPAVPDRSAERAGGRDPAVSDELASALAALAAEYAPLPMSTAPFMSAKQKEVDAGERRRRLRERLVKLGAGLLVAVGVLYAVASTLLFRFPSDEALAAAAARTAQEVILLHTSDERPLEIDRAIPVLRESIAPNELRYYAEVTLRLRQPLYGPALTNGTVSYRMLQDSLQRAREQELKFKFFPPGAGPQPPELPQLLQLLHRAGDPLVVRVPFEAEKFGWRWRLKPAQLALRIVSGRFEGATLDHFADAPYLIFGVPETMGDIRARMQSAREFIIAITKEIQRRADVEAVAEAPLVEPAPAPAAAEAPLPVDPNKPAVAPVKPSKPDQPPGPFR